MVHLWWIIFMWPEPSWSLWSGSVAYVLFPISPLIFWNDSVILTDALNVNADYLWLLHSSNDLNEVFLLSGLLFIYIPPNQTRDMLIWWFTYYFVKLDLIISTEGHYELPDECRLHNTMLWHGLTVLLAAWRQSINNNKNDLINILYMIWYELNFPSWVNYPLKTGQSHRVQLPAIVYIFTVDGHGIVLV